jgi:hypothetical protein
MEALVLKKALLPVHSDAAVLQGKRKPLEACLREVDRCDVVIAIVAHRYGWVPEDQPAGGTKSITRRRSAFLQERSEFGAATVHACKQEIPTDRLDLPVSTHR